MNKDLKNILALGMASGLGTTAALVADRKLAEARYRREAALDGGNVPYTPDPLPYVMNPELDYLTTAGELRNGMTVIEEPPEARHCFSFSSLTSQAIRAQEPYMIENFQPGAAGTSEVHVRYCAVWADGYRENRVVFHSNRFIARKTPATEHPH